RFLIQHYVCKRVRDQFDAFTSGFSELVPFDLINLFDEYELKLIRGTSKIDVDDWIKHTSERQSRFLRFAAGSPRVPVKGFQELKWPFTKGTSRNVQRAIRVLIVLFCRRIKITSNLNRNLFSLQSTQINMYGLSAGYSAVILQ
ncbi:hypothetical protein F5887DRAFT_888011, partial [Amanita rubescens]